MDRKRFIKKFGKTVFMFPLLPQILQANNKKNFAPENSERNTESPLNTKSDTLSFVSKNTPIAITPGNEGYWLGIAKQFERTPNMINLENGYFSHQPIAIKKQHQEFEDYINTYTSWFMRREQQKAIEDARKAFAEFQQIPIDELVFTRNTTESLNIIISGFPWKAGDEVIIGDHDYGSMVEAFHQAAKRFQITIKIAKVPEKPANVQEIIDAYAHLINEKTAMVHITDLINLHGQVLPTYHIAEHIKRRSPEVFIAVDAAHSVAHTLDSIGKLMEVADACGGSLHKWMCNPIGLGFLTMKKTQVVRFWPLMGDTGLAESDIKKFEHQGTRPIHTLQTLPKAIDFHQKIGSKNKLNRLQYLKSIWMGNIDEAAAGITIPDNWTGLKLQLKPLSNFPNIKIYGEGIWQPTLPGVIPTFESGAIATVGISGLTPAALADKLLKEYNIFTVAIDHPEVKGVRITPHLSSTFKDCALLNIALQKIANEKH